MCPFAFPQRFAGFGTCSLAYGRVPPATQIVLPAAPRAARRLLRQRCPALPGVYGMIDVGGELIYVGKSKALRGRLLSYLSVRPSNDKSRRIIRRTKRLVWEPAPHEFTALVRELELIRRWQPRMNVRGRPRRGRLVYVGVGRGPACYVFLTAGPSSGVIKLFGPLMRPGRWREAVRQVNNHFQLRTCAARAPIGFAEQLELFSTGQAARCLRHELGNCLAPCAARCTGGQYAERVRAACDFLGGADVTILDRLEESMWAAAEGREFERAARLRDAWEAMRRLHNQLKRLRDVRRDCCFVYCLPDYDGGESWHLVQHGQIAASIPSPRDPSAAAECLRLLQRVYSSRGPQEGVTVSDDPVVVLTVDGWFRRHPAELARTISPAEAERRCRGAMAKPPAGLVALRG